MAAFNKERGDELVMKLKTFGCFDKLCGELVNSGSNLVEIFLASWQILGVSWRWGELSGSHTIVFIQFNTIYF